MEGAEFMDRTKANDHFHIPIIHFVSLPQVLLGRACQKKLKTIVYEKFGGKQSAIWESGNLPFPR